MTGNNVYHNIETVIIETLWDQSPLKAPSLLQITMWACCLHRKWHSSLTQSHVQVAANVAIFICVYKCNFCIPNQYLYKWHFRVNTQWESCMRVWKRVSFRHVRKLKYFWIHPERLWQLVKYGVEMFILQFHFLCDGWKVKRRGPT